LIAMRWLKKNGPELIVNWLRSQVEEVAALKVSLNSDDGQIFRGYIPQVEVSAETARYRGLPIYRVQLYGENIRVNFGQVLRGKNFNLLEPVPVRGEIELRAESIRSSLSSPLLVDAFASLVAILLEVEEREIGTICWQELEFGDNVFALKGLITDISSSIFPIAVSSGLKLASERELLFSDLLIETEIKLPVLKKEEVRLDLGEHVCIEDFNLWSEGLFCRGGLVVMPADDA